MILMRKWHLSDEFQSSHPARSQATRQERRYFSWGHKVMRTKILWCQKEASNTQTGDKFKKWRTKVDNKDGDYQKHASTTSANKAGGKKRQKEDKAKTDATKPARKGDKSKQMETKRRRSHAGKQMSTKKSCHRQQAQRINTLQKL